MIYKNEIPTELFQAVKAGNCVPFIGAGMSKTIGLPLWSDLIQIIVANLPGLSARQKRDIVKKFDFLQIPQHYIDSAGGSRDPLISLLKPFFDRASRKYDRQHELLAQLPIRTYITTNWDRAIENALSSCGIRSNVIYRDNHVPYWDEGSDVQIIKMHGTMDDPNSIVISHQDYLTYSADHRALEELLRTLLSTRSLLLLGFSLRDPNFDRLYHQICSFYGSDRHPTYAVFVNEPRYLLDYWSNRGVTIISSNVKLAENIPVTIQNLLERLVEGSSTRAYTKYDRTRLLLREYRHQLPVSGQGFCVRIRASLGSFASPKPTNAFRIFSDEIDTSPQAFELDLNEWRINQLCRRYIKKGATVKCLLSRDSGNLISKYTQRQAVRRLGALERHIRAAPVHVEVLFRAGQFDYNTTIFDDASAVESVKMRHGSRLYDSAEILIGRRNIRNRIEDFDKEFAVTKADVMMDATRSGVTGATEAEILRKMALKSLQTIKREVLA